VVVKSVVDGEEVENSWEEGKLKEDCNDVTTQRSVWAATA
jgi:hypothetical protein